MGLNESMIHVDFMIGTKDLKITGLNRKIEKRIIKYFKKRGLFERGKYYE